MIAAIPLRLLATLCVVGSSLQQNTPDPIDQTVPLPVQAAATAKTAGPTETVKQQSVNQPSTAIAGVKRLTRAEEQQFAMYGYSDKVKHLQKRFDAISTILQDSRIMSEGLNSVSHTYSPMLDIGGWSMRRDNETGKMERIPEPTAEELGRWHRLRALEAAGMQNLTKRLNKVKALVADVESTVTGVDADNAVSATELKVKMEDLDPPKKQWFKAPKSTYNYSTAPAQPLQRSVNWYNKSNFNSSKPDDTVAVTHLKKELAEQRMMNMELLSQVDELKLMISKHVLQKEQQQQPAKSEATPPQDEAGEKAAPVNAEKKVETPVEPAPKEVEEKAETPVAPAPKVHVELTEIPVEAHVAQVM